MSAILTDSNVAERVFENERDKAKYKIYTIQDDGTVIMGKTRVKWWNRLLNCQDEFPFECFALRIWDALVDLSSGLNNKAIMEGLSKEIVINAVRKRNYDWVVARLYDCWSHVAQKSSGYQETASPEGDPVNDQGRERVIVAPATEHNIVLNVNGVKKVITPHDSIGDPFNFDLEIGVVNVRKH